MSRAPAKQEAPAKGAKTAAVNAAKPATAKTKTVKKKAARPAKGVVKKKTKSRR